MLLWNSKKSIGEQLYSEKLVSMRYAEYVIALVLVSRIILVSWIITFWHTSLTTVEEKRLRKTEGNYYS